MEAYDDVARHRCSCPWQMRAFFFVSTHEHVGAYANQVATPGGLTRRVMDGVRFVIAENVDPFRGEKVRIR